MKKLLLLLAAVAATFTGCYSTDEPVGPDVPVVGELKLSQEQMTVSAEGGEFSVDIFTEYSYETSTNVDWITISGSNYGAEYCTLYFTVAKNITSSEREGVITVFCDDYNLLATLTVSQKSGSQISNNEIWYTSTDGAVVEPYKTDVFGANIVSNTYANGKGVIKFDAPVTSIGESAFEYCTSLTSVTIGNRVTSIGESAFEYCTSLTSVTIGNRVTSIGYYAFSDCTSLTRVDISDLSAWCKISFGNQSANPLYYGAKLYLNGSELTDITIPSDITEIKAYAFSGYTSLTSVTIPDSVTSIGMYAFYGCTSLTSITIPDSVTSIERYTFEGCTSLTSVTIPNSVTEIGHGAFRKCI